MPKELIPVVIKGIMPTAGGCAVFLGDDGKSFVIHMDPNMGLAISLHLQHVHKERPLTHDLIGTIFMGLGIELQHIVVNDIKESTFFARVILRMNNELGTKVVEIDARPSDAIVLALQGSKPIYVTQKVYDSVEDITDLLAKLKEDQPPEEEPDKPDWA